MLLNDLEKDIRHLLVDEDMSQAQLAEKTGLSRQHIYYNVKHPTLPNLIMMAENIGYDVKVEFIRKEQKQ